MPDDKKDIDTFDTNSQHAPRRSVGDKINRRRFLLQTGTAATALTVPTTVSAKERDPKKLLAQSLKILEATGSQEKRHKFLRNRGFKTARDSHIYKMPTGGDQSDGISPQSFSSSDLDITIGLFIDSSGDGTYAADLSWWYEYGSGSGGYPRDVAGIGWDENWWDYESYQISETTYKSHQYDYQMRYADGSSGSGPAFEVNDYDAWNHEHDALYYFGAYIEPLGNYSSDQRRIQGAYNHLWSGVTVNSISVGYPFGVNVSVGDSSKKWKTDTEKDGDTLLRLRQNQATF